MLPQQCQVPLCSLIIIVYFLSTKFYYSNNHQHSENLFLPPNKLSLLTASPLPNYVTMDTLLPQHHRSTDICASYFQFSPYRISLHPSVKNSPHLCLTSLWNPTYYNLHGLWEPSSSLKKHSNTWSDKIHFMTYKLIYAKNSSRSWHKSQFSPM